MLEDDQESIDSAKQRVQEFIRLTPSQGVSNFVLEGPIHDEDVNTTVFAALFPNPFNEMGLQSAIFTTDSRERGKMAYYHSRILRLEISERIRNFHVPDDDFYRTVMTGRCILNGWPVTAITFSCYQQTLEEVVMMYTIAGNSPDTALREFQIKSRERISMLS